MVGMQRDLETDDASLQNTLLTYDHGFVVAVLRSMRSSELWIFFPCDKNHLKKVKLLI
jgi:hypothetical protein